MPHISVIVPNYNHAQFLEMRVNSILSQTYQDFELIILDDFSTDNSREIIEQYRSNPKVKCIVFNKTNSGSAFGQWEQGVGLAQGEWIWIAESDDFAAPTFLEECVNTKANDPQVGVCYCDSLIWDEDKQEVLESYSEQKNRVFNTLKWNYNYCKNGIDEINECFKYNCTINNVSAMIFKKELSFSILPDLKYFSYYGDWYFCLRLLIISNICYVPKSLNTYRKHYQSHLNSPTSLIRTRKEYFEILKFLWYQKKVSNKHELLNCFTYNFLSFGIYEDGINTGYTLIKNYLKSDLTLGIKVFLKIFSIKIFVKKYKSKYDIIEKTDKK